MPAATTRPPRGGMTAPWIRRILFVLAAVGLIVPLAFGGTASASLSVSPVALTDKGLVRGIGVDGVRQFRGIPYAAAPVGDLRWRAPQPATPWRGIRDASAFGPHCAQPATVFGQASTSEDCLFLNVYQPRLAVPGQPVAPVMVWIHGGALTTGESDDYDPADLVSRGVVVVTINYRLGALGFLAHPAMAGESAQGAAGNYGLMDQQAALAWVQRNIRHFGGNPRNVTIFGESAGGLSVHSQLASPLAAGLFHRAIVESGAYQLTQASLTTAEGLATAFATASGCADQSAACLRSLPVATILAHQSAAINAPTLDGLVLTRSIGDAFTSGEFNKVDVMEGSNHDEWRLFVAEAEVTTGVPLTAAGYIPAISRTLGVPTAVATALAGAYPLADYASPSLALSALGTDAIFACNARKAVTALSTHTTTYQYEFIDPGAPMPFFPPVSFPTGSYHAAEIQFIFNLATRPAFTADETALSATMVRYWSQFAWTGNPNGPATPHWPAFGAAQIDQALRPGATTTATDFATDHKCAVFGG